MEGFKQAQDELHPRGLKAGWTSALLTLGPGMQLLSFLLAPVKINLMLLAAYLK